jgi:hypothetical protein
MEGEFDLMGPKAADDIGDKYRFLFKTSVGQAVLADILRTTHFGVTLDPDNPAMIAEYNAGLIIMAKAGILDDVKTILGLRDSAH